MAGLDDSKVMDVSKPGKGKVISTSRPVVTPLTASQKKENNPSGIPAKEEAEAVPPSASHKVISPINDLSSAEDSDTPQNPEEDKPEAAEEPVQDTGSEEAEVNALAESVESKKQAAKRAEEQAKKDVELQALIDSKKYVVPISRGGASGNKVKAALVAVAFLAVAAIAGYLLIDFGIIRSDIKLPYEFSKEESSGNKDSTPAINIPAETDEEEEVDNTEDSESSAEPNSRANDQERKNELKNLQTKLEIYFNDNGVYPADLSELDPMPTTEELHGPSNDPYTYTTDGDSYTLAAELENDNDPDADSSGIYVLTSVNQ